jgi:tetratricopeptide (TPR) repeat protein
MPNPSCRFADDAVFPACLPTYAFQAVQPNGFPVNGTLEADSLAAAREHLTGIGYIRIRFLRSFVFQASSPKGVPVTSEVEAENLDEAKAILTGNGFTGIRFHDSENIDAIRKETLEGAGLAKKYGSRLTPKEDMGSRSRRTLRQKVLWAVGRHMVYLGPLLLWNAVSLSRPGPFSKNDILGIVATGIYIPWMVLKLMPMICYNQILDASAWNDWPRMRRFIRIARFARRFLGMGIPENDLMMREAYALSAEGRLQEAVALMEVVRPKFEKSPHLFLPRLGTVFQYAGQFDMQHACMVDALECGPKRSLEWVDHGLFLARMERDIPGAKEALAQARKFEMAEMTKAAALMCAGMISIAERDYAQAHADLTQAVAALQVNASNAIGDLFTAHAKAYLAIACARLGRKEEALELWTDVGPLIRARREGYIRRAFEEAMLPNPGLN